MHCSRARQPYHDGTVPRYWIAQHIGAAFRGGPDNGSPALTTEPTDMNNIALG